MTQKELLLITGGSGFIGNHIARAFLKHGYRVRLFVRPGSPHTLISGLDVELAMGDLTSYKSLRSALNGCSGLVHAAGYYPLYSLFPDQIVANGLKQIQNIHDALSESTSKRFLYISSPSAVGKYRKPIPEDEAAPYPQWRNFSAYCRVKHAMQTAVQMHSGLFNSLSIAPTAVFGPGDIKPTTGRLIVDIAKGRVPFLIRGRTNMVDVRDLAEGVVQAFDRGKTGRLYVMGNENLSLPALVRRIAVATGQTPPKIELSPRWLLPLAMLSEWMDYFLGKEKPLFPMVGLHFAMTGEYLSSDLAKKEIGYNPVIPAERTLRDTYQWFRDKGYIA